MGRTPIPLPSPTVAAAYLTSHFGTRVADILSLHLAKSAAWPHWRVMAVLFYLRDQPVASASLGLVRFAAETGNQEHMNRALDAIRASRHPGLAREIASERERARELNRVFPPALASCIAEAAEGTRASEMEA
jgi:hypothetical protein